MNTDSYLEKVASSLVLLGLLAAPWIAGSTALWKGGVWILCSILCTATFLSYNSWKNLILNENPPLPPWGKWIILGGLACLAWWYFQPLPEFASAFTANQIESYRERNSSIMLQPLPRNQQLAFLGSLLFALPAVAKLSRHGAYRRWAAYILAVNAVLISIYAIAAAEFNAPPIPWIGVPESISQYSSPFFVYAGAGTAVAAGLVSILGLLHWRNSSKKRWAIVVLASLLCLYAYSYWPTSSLFIAALVLVIIFGLLQIEFFRRLTDKVGIQLISLVVLLLIFASQLFIAKQTDAESGQNWVSPERTRTEMAVRDVSFKFQSAHREDRLLTSDSPNRPMTWMAAMRMSLDHPLLGKGPGSWTRTSSLYSNDTLVNSFALCLLYSHNDALQTTAEWGILPGAALILLWLTAYWRQWKRAKRGELLECSWALVLLALTLSSFLHWPLQIPALQFWGLIAVGIGLGYREKPRQSRS